MNYVEWLRVRNCLRHVAIVLGVLVVLGAGARVWLQIEFNNVHSVVQTIGKDPGTIVTHTTYDGRPRTIMVNPREHVRITIDEEAGGGRSVTIVRPKTSRGSDSESDTFGSVKVTTTTGAVNRTTHINTNSPVPIDYYLMFAYIVALIVATVLGASFSRENDGHLEYALLKPISRERFALGVIAADLAGILAAMLLAVVASIIGQAFFEVPRVDFSGFEGWFAATVVLVPFAWWALLNAATASLRRGAGAIVGFSWPVSALIVVIAGLDLSATTLGQAVHAAAWGLSRLLPLAYGSFHSSHMAPSTLHIDNVIAVLVLLVVYSALIVAQWRRVEA